MEDFNLEKYKVTGDVEVAPIIVLTSTEKEFEEFCAETGRDRKTAIQVSAAFQLAHYPELEIVHYKNFWLNGSYNSLEYKDRIFKQKMAALEEK